MKIRKTVNSDTSSEISSSQISNIDDPEFDQTLCRVCLKEGDIPIFDLKDLSEDLGTFAGIEVSDLDPYPKSLCLSCSAVLEGAILFRRTAQESDCALRNSGQNINSKIHLSACANKADEQDIISNDVSDLDEQFFKSELDEEILASESDILDKQASDSDIEFDTEKETCPICNKSYVSSYIKQHLILHKHERLYVCDICDKKFKVRAYWRQHRKRHFIDELPFQCSVCPYKGRTKLALKVHTRQHTGEKPYKCPLCPSRFFANPSNLKTHLNRTHRTDYDFKCDECNRGFYTKKDLEMHIKVDHRGIKDHICNLCGKAFGYRKQMMKHQLQVHKRDKLRQGVTPLYMILESQKQLESTNDTDIIIVTQ